ncbi:MAG TPA: PH domain-containing protein [Blastococcus sp.]|nr:PH domain-containing protein [Blastococcus sp.]
MTVPTPRPPRSARARKDIQKYLLANEGAVIITRRHWAVLLEPTVKFLPVFAIGVVLLVLDPTNRLTSTVGLLVMLGALLLLGLRVAEWWMRHFIVSTRRILLTSGVIVRTVTLIPLRRITDLTWQETLLGQVLNYGTFRFESAGQDQALRHLTYLPDAERRYQEISALLFAKDFGAAASGGDDEGNEEPVEERRRAPREPAGGRSVRQDTLPIPGLPPAEG